MTAKKLVALVRKRFEALADDANAKQMAAYMKTEMPFYGIKKPERVPVHREMFAEFPVTTQEQYKEYVLTLWDRPHREEKYAAIQLALKFKKFISHGNLPLYRKLIVEGAWWDLVDDVAIKLSGKVLLDEREKTRSTFEKWIDHKNMWLRRSAIIGQIKHKDETDEEMLFEYCRSRAHEKEFFIRKAIGWALREYAKTRPGAVRKFLKTHERDLSGLSYREAGKHL